MREVVVGVDFGSSRIKAAAYGRDGQLVASAATDTPLHLHVDGDDFRVGAMLDGAGATVRALGLESGQIVGLATASMGEVGTIVGPDGVADIEFPAWYDGRGRDIVERLENSFGPQNLRDATGRHLRVASTVAKLGHAAARDGGAPTGTFVGICGALGWALTGHAWQEAGLATTSGVYDPLADGYLTDVWEAAGLGNVALAEVHAPSSWYPAATEAAQAWGIRRGAPVMIAGHDHPVAAVGTGAVPGELVDSMGTGEAIIGVMRGESAASANHHRAVLDMDSLLSIEVWPVTGEPLVVWERLRPGLAMRSFLARAALSRDELDAQAPAPAPATVMNDEISRALETGAPAELAYDAPAWADLIDFYVELANHGQRLVREATGSDGAVVLTGGGLRSQRWRASKAMLGSGPMEVSTASETGTRGCAAMVGVALGWWESPESMPAGEKIAVSQADAEAMERAANAIR